MPRLHVDDYSGSDRRRTGPGGIPDGGPVPGRPVPPTPSAELLTLIGSTLPEFVPRVMQVVDECGDDPGEPVILSELAEFVTRRLRVLRRALPVVERAAVLVETWLGTAVDDGVMADMVASSFFDDLSFDERSELRRWLGPRSREVLESLDAPGY